MDESERITFAGHLPVGYDFEADESRPPGQQFGERLFDPGVAIAASLDWSKVPLPVLSGPPLRPGEVAELDDPEHGLETMDYGHHELWG